MPRDKKVWVVIPAAGVGERMQAECPKQYLMLSGQPILQHTLQRLVASVPFAGVVVVLHRNDTYWQRLIDVTALPVTTVIGGDSRSDSVYNGLVSLAAVAADDDWVLIHDAARPCVRVADIQTLLASAEKAGTGALLAVPINDTVKRATATGQVDATVDRTRLWRALTPQVFPYAKLKTALQRALESGEPVTDEAMAMERQGEPVLLVPGAADNIKITRPDDLVLAGGYLELARESKSIC